VAPPVLPDNGRSGDDKIIIFTGGTTGLPMGVLWRHEDFYFSMLSGANPFGAPYLTVGEVAAAARQAPPGGIVITAPLMHGAGTLFVFLGLLLGGQSSSAASLTRHWHCGWSAEKGRRELPAPPTREPTFIDG
jgi:acyl-CoA synthetase (AMP-forming)/AMP-acid ligase II